MGQGKSSLTAMVIGDVLATSTNAVAFAYCSENASPFDLVRTARNKSINILRCLLAQCAILPDGTVAKAAQYAYDCSSRQKAGEYDANLGSLVRLLQEVILEHPSRQVTFVVDALDECSDRSELVTRLKEIARSGASVRIFVSARPHISISPAFDRRTYQTVIMESLNIDDIRSYVDVEVSKRYEISGMDPSQADRLRAALKRQADGMFRWVVLEIDLFLPKEDVSDPPADIERRLCNLEASKAPALTRLLDAYSDIYELALGKPDATSRRHCVQSAIDWALCCLKPLTVEDLVRTACVQSDGGPDIGLDGNTLLKYCSSLLIVTARGTIRLAHLSVRQFFEERKAEQFSKDHMHKRIALTSITVRRRTKDPHSRSGVTQDGREWLIDLNTGLSSTERYCFWNWSTHYRLSKTCSIAAAQMEHHQGDLVTPIDDLLLWTATVPDLAIQDSMGNTVLHRAIYDRRMDYVIALLHVASVSGSNDLLTKRNNAGKNALHLAALTAFAEAANLLLSTGADLMGVDACGLTALHLGVLSDCEALISSAGFDGLQATRLAAATLGGNTLLHFAAFFDRDSRVRESLILGFGLDAKNVRDETALDLAKLQPSTTSTTTLISAREGRRRLGHQDRPGVCLVGARQCDLCSMEEWIAGSRSGRQYVVAPSVHAMSQNRSCKLCSAASHLLLEQLGEQEDSAEVKVKLTLNCDTDLEDGADTIKYTVSSTAECEFELCIIDDGDIYDIDFEDLGERKATFQSRSFQPSGISNAIQHWRKDCKFHARCGREGDRRWPKRVIEVGTSDASGQELTLKLREARPGPQCDERAEDWGEHIIMLPSYIVDADMVFAATAPSVVVSLNPLPQDENIICRYTATLLLTGDTSDEIFEIAVRRSLRVAARVVQEDVISRAWRLQEAVLAERLVIFGTEQVYWSCSAGLGSQSRMSLASRPPIRTLTVFLEDEREIAVDGILDFKLRRVFDYWYYLAHLNNNGKLTVSPGRLSTVAALASALSPYAESEYSAGLWNADIVRGLLWQSQLPRSHSTAGNSRYDAPSWSWASANGPISYSLAAGLSKSRKVGVSKTHRFAVLENNVHEDAPFSNVQLGSSIRVSSHSCRVAQLDPAILSKYDYFFDDASFGFLQRTEERLADVTLILLAPWTYTPEGKSRWAGLMISNERWQTVSDSYHRRGIFLGPACGTDLSAWKRREFVLV
ncbi:hypothetical protein LTR29_007576 [Friedmanniomyces endolithicus]|nr:hypothetical protein LTR29_007576 [Friedmanniomyces endolithicus]